MSCFDNNAVFKLFFLAFVSELKRRRFACEECGRVCSSKWALRVHYLRHGEKTFKCDVCEKMFYTKTELMQHAKLMHFEGGMCTQMLTVYSIYICFYDI